MARRKKKRNLNSELKNHQNNLKNQNNLADRLDEGVETSVVDQYAAPNVGDMLHSDIPETQAEANRGLENTSVQADDYLEGSPISQPVAEGNVESETDAGVADGETRPHPGETVGEEEAGLNASLQPENKTPKTSKVKEGVSTSVVNQYGAPDMNDMLHSDVPETQAEANRGLENTSVQSNDYLEGETIEQHQAEGDVQAETDSAVADGTTAPRPGQTVGEEEAGLNASLQTEEEQTQASPKKTAAQGVSTSVVNQYAAPNVGDMLHSDVPETQAEANRGLENTSVQSNDYLEGETIEQHQAEGDVQAETDAAVADGTTAPHPGQTVGEEEAGLNASLQTEEEQIQASPKKTAAQGVSTSVVNQYGAPNVGDMLHSDIPETQAQADRGLENTSVQSNDYLEGETIEQHQAEGDAQAETDAAVAAGTTAPHPGQTVGQAEAGLNASLQPEQKQTSPETTQAKGVSTSVVNQYGAPNIGDMLHSDIPETQAQADRGLENTSVQSNDYLEGETIEQHQAEGDAQAETDAAVAAGATAPHPGQTVGQAEAGLNASLQPEQKQTSSETTQAKGVSTSVVNQYAAPNVGDMLHSDIPETQAQADRGLENASIQSNDYLEGETIEQHQAEGNVQAETDAAVAAGATAPHPGQTVGQAEAGLNASLQPEQKQTSPETTQAKGVSTSVVNQYGAPNVGDMLHSDIPETQAQADRGLENASIQSNDYLEGETIEQHQAEGNVQAETDAAVAAGATAPHPGQTVGQAEAGLNASLQPEQKQTSPENTQAKGVSTSVVNQYAAPNVGDMLHSDIPETQAQANRGLENTSVQSNDYLEGETIEQHQAEGNVQAETDAAVNAGVTKPHPAQTVGEEQEDIPESMKLSPEEVNKLFNEPVENLTLNIDADEAHVNIEEPENDNKKYNALNHSVEKDLPIYLL